SLFLVWVIAPGERERQTSATRALLPRSTMPTTISSRRSTTGSRRASLRRKLLHRRRSTVLQSEPVPFVPIQEGRFTKGLAARMTPPTLSADRIHPERRRYDERREIQEMPTRNFCKAIIKQILKVSQQFIKGASDRQNQTLWLDQHRKLCIDYKRVFSWNLALAVKSIICLNINYLPALKILPNGIT